MPDNAYGLTRRKGRRVTVSRFVTSTGDPETLNRVEQRAVTNIRFCIVQPTTYMRLIRAKATAQDVGETTFIFWTKDLDFDRLTAEDYAIVGGKRYNFVESTVEETGLVATAREITGQIPNQTITASASNTLLSDSASSEVTP